MFNKVKSKRLLWVGLVGCVVFLTKTLIGIKPEWVAKYPQKQYERALQDSSYVFAQDNKMEAVAELLLRNTHYQPDKIENIIEGKKTRLEQKTSESKVDPLLVLKKMVEGDFGGKSGQVLEDDFEKAVAIAVKLVQSKNPKIRKQAHAFLMVLLNKKQGFDQVRALLKKNRNVDTPWKAELVKVLGDKYKDLIPNEQPKRDELQGSLEELKKALQLELEKISRVLTPKVMRKMGYPEAADQAVIQEFLKIYAVDTAYTPDDLDALKKILVNEVLPLDEIVSQLDDAGLCVELIDRMPKD